MRRILLWLCLALMPVTTWAAQDFTLDSPTLKAGASMPLANVYAQCGGGNVSPALQWHDAPAGTKGYAVTMYKPHHYVITVYAMDVPELGPATHFSRNDALAAIKQHTLATATLTVTWGH